MEYKGILMLKIAAVVTTAFLIVFGLFFEKDPSFMDLQKQGPGSLTYFFDNPIPNQNLSDPYISSLYRPGDILYQALTEYQNHRLDLAIPKLQKLSEEGNVDAMYWYAEHLMKVSVKSRYAGYNWFEKSAKLGNPYSALKLDINSGDCQSYFPTLCNKKWGKLAVESFKIRANQGDIRAKYYLERPTSFVRGDDFKNWVSLVEESAKQNYFIPAMDLLQRFENDKSLTLNQKEDLKHIYNFLAKHNFVPAYNALYVHSNYETVFDEAVKLGSSPQLSHLAQDCVAIFNDLERSEKKECLAQAYVLEEIYNDDTNFDFIPPLGDSTLNSEAKNRAEAIINSMKLTIYIDELHIDNY